MKTISSANQTALAANRYTPIYAINLYCQDSTTYKWATCHISTSGDGAEWNPSPWYSGIFIGDRIASLGTVKFALKSTGGLATVAKFSFKLTNVDDYYRDTLSSHDLSNARIEVFRLIIEASPDGTAGGIQMCSLRVYDWDWDDEFITIHCRQNETMHRDIPRTLIEEKNFSSNTIPENSNGMPVPMVFGELKAEKGSDGVWSGGPAKGVFNNADKTIENIDGSSLKQSVATDGGERTLEDTDQSWSTDEWADKELEIVGGTGKGQVKIIDSNTSDEITITDVFETQPVAEETVYQISDTQFDMILSDEEIHGFMDTADKISGDSGYDANDHACWFWDNQAKLYVPFNSKILQFKNDSSPFTDQAGVRFAPGAVKAGKLAFYYPIPFDNVSDKYDSGDMITIPGFETGLADGYWNDDFSNVNNIKDWDYTTYASATQTTGRDVGGDYYYYLGCLECCLETDHSDLIGTWDYVQLYVVCESVMASPSDTHIACQFYNKAGTLLQGVIFPGTSGAEVIMLPSLISPDSSEAQNVAMVNVTNFLPSNDWPSLNHNFIVYVGAYSKKTLAAGASVDYAMRIKEAGFVFIKIVEMNERTPFFFNIKGREFGDTWGARKTSGNMIENPADIIEKILRDDLGEGSSAINTSSFDTVSSTDRSDWDMAYQIDTVRNSLKEIKDIGKEALFWYYIDGSGDHALKALKTSGSAAKTLNYSDLKRNQSTGKTMAEYELSPLDEVYNEFYVHYDKHPATGEYQKVAFIKEPDAASYNSNYVSTMHVGSDLYGNESTYWGYCETSYDTYGFIKTKHFKLDRIRDDVTAENVLANLIKWYYLRKKIAKLHCGIEQSDIEIGDLIGLPAECGGETCFVMMISDDLDGDDIYFEMREV